MARAGLGRVRTQVWGAVRLVASVAMLAVLLPRAARLLDPLWKPSTFLWLAGAIAVTLLGVVLATLRWQRVLMALDVRTKVGPLLSNYLAGLFVSNFLPTTIGGDVLRVTRLSQLTHERPRSFASVVLERLTGWVVLPVISLFTLLINPGLLRFLNAVHLGLARFRRRPGAAFEVLVVGFAYQIAVMLAAFFAAKALGLPVGWTAVLAFMPAVAIVQVLPFPTIGGLGIREGAFVLFLHPLGVSTDQAIALGLIVYGINLLASLLGAPAFAVGNRPAQAPASA